MPVLFANKLEESQVKFFKKIFNDGF